VISRGRLDMGFIKGVPYEFACSNQNPVGVMDRFWEAHDFILKAMTSHDAPFNWEGEFFHYRQVNIWPRPWQQPHPPLWSTTNTRLNARVLGERGYVVATLGSGYNTRPIYDAYRQGYVSRGRPAPGADRFAYLGLVAVADNEEEARRRGELVAGYLRSSAIVHPPFRNPPGFVPVEDYARMLKGETPPRTRTRDGRVVSMYTGSVQDLIEAGVLFCGTPDQVYRQIVDFCDYCGGMGNLLMMGHAGFLTHEDTVANLTLFAKEVFPRLKEYKQPVAEVTEAA
jgi:alkanesulfonate monooxygenase SsuD/methylene tetrahydromethanopterin reductase-like flavin-dependent oxidoreductase (luciferase family)